MKQAFKDVNFSRATEKTIREVENILETVAPLTVRQLYYQLVGKGIISNNVTEYKRISRIVNDARLAGVIDWDDIEDRTRNIKEMDFQNMLVFDYVHHFLNRKSHEFFIDYFAHTSVYYEIWAEKDSVIPVLDKFYDEFHISYLVTRGFLSQTEIYAAAQRIKKRNQTQKTIILYIGDHDPSGLEVFDDIAQRLTIMCDPDDFEMHWIMLTEEQAREFNLVENVTKREDSRSKKYIEQFGVGQWELESLTPPQIEEILRAALINFVTEEDKDEVVKAKVSEQKLRTELQKTIDAHFAV